MQLTTVYNAFDPKQANVGVIAAISGKWHASRFSFFKHVDLRSTVISIGMELHGTCYAFIPDSLKSTIEKWVLSNGEDRMKLRHSARA
jgi:hypothetical protein